MRLTEEEYQKILQKQKEHTKEKKNPEEKHEIRHDFKKKHKYNAKKTERDGFKFASQKEARRYDQLILLKESGDVLFFLRQCPFHLPGNVTYRIDFIVFWADGHVSMEDVKGMVTPQYKMKKKMVEALYPVEIVEV